MRTNSDTNTIHKLSLDKETHTGTDRCKGTPRRKTNVQANKAYMHATDRCKGTRRRKTDVYVNE